MELAADLTNDFEAQLVIDTAEREAAEREAADRKLYLQLKARFEPKPTDIKAEPETTQKAKP
jgi:hypothetical protein